MGCKDCGASKVDHPVVGVCRRCYKRAEYIKYKDKHLETKRRYYERTKEARNKKLRQGRPPRKAPEIEHRFTEKARYQELQRKCLHNKRYSDIGFECFKDFISQPCHYCSGPLAKTGIGLDRKDPNQWYLFDNVVPCCKTCNLVKNNLLTYDEMVAAMKAVLEVRGRK